MTNQPANINFYSQIVDLLQSARNQVVRTVNHTMVRTYFEIGKMLVGQEQGGEEGAEYGKELLKGLSKVLTDEFGRGFSVTNLKQMRQFYVSYGIGQTLSDHSVEQNQQTLSAKSIWESTSQRLNAEFNLSWSHYLKLMRIDDENERSFRK